MNCDYVIHIDGKIIYIEIAGILSEYKTWFYANKLYLEVNQKKDIDKNYLKRIFIKI